ncbi:MAG TPA: BACON domain-containing carbohydrate-binding protein [Propionicimonas sp.]
MTVTAATGCAWAASSNASWLTVTSGSSGTGNGTVTYSAASNAATSSRSATITIGGQTFWLDQGATTGTGCRFTFSPSSWTAPAAGGYFSVRVTPTSTTEWCDLWAPTIDLSNPNYVWVEIDNPGWRTGPDVVRLYVQPKSGSSRTIRMFIEPAALSGRSIDIFVITQ